MTSEQRHNIMQQPKETCPIIDAVLKSVKGILKDFRYVEMSLDLDTLKESIGNAEHFMEYQLDNALEDIRRNCADIRAWGQEWKDRCLEKADILEEIKEMI